MNYMIQLFKHHFSLMWIALKGFVILPFVLLITLFIAFWMSISLSFDSEFKFMRWLKDLKHKISEL